MPLEHAPRHLSDLPAAAAANLDRHHRLAQGISSFTPLPSVTRIDAASSPTGVVDDRQNAASYKQLKEAWIADQTGGSIHDINLLSLTMLNTTAVRSIARALARLSDWQLELAILILPAIAAHTVLGDHLLILNVAMASVAAFLYVKTADGPLLRPNNGDAKGKADAGKPQRKRHWSKKASDDEDGDDVDDQDLDLVQLTWSTDPQGKRAPSIDLEPPIRVSIDSAADAAHAAAAPPVPYTGPSGSDDVDSSFRDALPRSPLAGHAASSSGSFGVASSDDSHSGRQDWATYGQEIGSGLGLSRAQEASNADDGAWREAPTSRGGLALSTSYTTTSAPNSRLSSPLLSSGNGPFQHRSSLSSSSPLSPLARSVIDPRDAIRKAAASRAASSTAASAAAQAAPASLFVREQPFLTVYRSHMMLLTVICILAVDFPAFPRRFAKCESWGTSLMDLGVGSFVFSLGIVSALPFLRSPRNRFTPLKSQLLRDLRRTLPLIALGMVRVIMVKGVEYPEHVTEYGVHWNFFFTLALLPFMASLTRPLSRWTRYNYLGLTVTLVHQLVLGTTSLQSWALSSTLPRDTLLRQNKEGLTSLPGYLAVFLLGLDLGHYVLPLDPYFAYRRLSKRRMKARPGKLAMILASLGVVWWSGYGIATLVGLRTSRRLANLPYVLWVAAFNTTFLLGYVLVYLVLLKPLTPRRPAPPTAASNSSQPYVEATLTPTLLADLNRHSLLVFLAANLLTGLVNVSIKTMWTPDWAAVALLSLYTAACCALATAFSRAGWRLKL